MCVNQEDGLSIRVMQGNDGSRELQAFWDEEVLDVSRLTDILQNSPLWEVFQLRANVLVEQHINTQIKDLEEAVRTCHILKEDSIVDDHIWSVTSKLRLLEQGLLLKAKHSLDVEVNYFPSVLGRSRLKRIAVYILTGNRKRPSLLQMWSSNTLNSCKTRNMLRETMNQRIPMT